MFNLQWWTISQKTTTGQNVDKWKGCQIPTHIPLLCPLHLRLRENYGRAVVIARRSGCLLGDSVHYVWQGIRTVHSQEDDCLNNTCMAIPPVGLPTKMWELSGDPTLRWGATNGHCLPRWGASASFLHIVHFQKLILVTCTCKQT